MASPFDDEPHFSLMDARECLPEFTGQVPIKAKKRGELDDVVNQKQQLDNDDVPDSKTTKSKVSESQLMSMNNTHIHIIHNSPQQNASANEMREVIFMAHYTRPYKGCFSMCECQKRKFISFALGGSERLSVVAQQYKCVAQGECGQGR